MTSMQYPTENGESGLDHLYGAEYVPWEDDPHGYEGSEPFDCAVCGYTNARVPTSWCGTPMEADAQFYKEMAENPKADENWQVLCMDCAAIPTLRYDEDLGFYRCSLEQHDEDVMREDFSRACMSQLRAENFAAQEWKRKFVEEVREADESRFFSMTTLKQLAADSKRQKIRKEQAQRLREAKERGDKRFGPGPIL